MSHVKFWFKLQTDMVAVVQIGYVLREPNPFHVGSSSCHNASPGYGTTTTQFLHQVHNTLLHHLNSEENLHADNVRVLPWVPRLHVDQAAVLHLDRLDQLAQTHYRLRQLYQDGQLHLGVCCFVLQRFQKKNLVFSGCFVF